MKLLLCCECQDVTKLLSQDRGCRCGKSHGKYVTDKVVEVTGPCEVLGLDNNTLDHGVTTLDQHPHGGPPVLAWVIPRGNPRVRRVSGGR